MQMTLGESELTLTHCLTLTDRQLDPGNRSLYKLLLYTGMDITCAYTSFLGFICDSVRLLHVMLDVIRTIVVRRRPNRMLTYVIT